MAHVTRFLAVLAVCALNAADWTPAASSEVSILVPSAPTNLTGQVMGSTVSLVWTESESPDAPVTSYVVEVADTPTFAVPNLANVETGNALTVLTAPGVPQGIYYVRLRARNALGLSPPSNEIQVVVGAGGGCPDAPPSLSAVSPIANAAVLSWSAPQTGNVESYIIQAGSSPGLSNLANFDTGSAALTYAAAGILAGSYYVRVLARTNGCPLSQASNEVLLVVDSGAGGGCPSAPRSLSAVSSATGSVSLSWLGPSTGSPDSYIIQAGSSPGLSNLANFDTGSATLTFAASGVPAGSYYVRVFSRKSGCPVSQSSNEVLLPVSGVPLANPLITLTLSYTCNPCTGDPDNYSLNVNCIAGKCTLFRTSNPSRSPNTITATLRLEPGVRNVEVVVRNPGGPWVLSFGRGQEPNTGGVVPNSFQILFPPSGGGLALGRCSVSGVASEAFLSFSVMHGAANAVC